MMVRAVVSTKLGKLEGILRKTCFGKSYNAFLAIPYAQQPIGKLRFRDPVPLIEPWRGVVQATKVTRHNVCHQFEPMIDPKKPIGSDNCLNLHVYSRSLKGAKPVIVFIHGGAFRTGSGGPLLYGPDYLLEHDCVVVNINYRLSAFGFLHLPREGIPGNAALKDQLLALQWVRDNIAEFGGDPENVTLYGHSSGAVLAHYHLLSPKSKGLFHRAVISSATAQVPWGLIEPSHLLDPNLRIARESGYTGKEANLLDYYEKVDPAKIVMADAGFGSMHDKEKAISFPFKPVIDGEFITKPPSDLVKDSSWGNQVNAIFGSCSLESCVNYKPISKLDLSKNETFEKILITSLKSTDGIEEKAKHLRNFYCKDTPTQESMAEIINDKMYLHGIYSSVRARTEHGKTWLYRFNVEPRAPGYDIFRGVFGVPHKKFSSHMEDLLYIFKGAPIPAPVEGSEEFSIVQNMTKFLADFAKTGNPGKEHWKPHDPNAETMNCLNIENESEKFIGLPELDRMKFWDSLTR